MTFSILSGLLGGLGLFLLGMRLMTQGLRNAAGPALRHILGQWTKTPLRGLGSGFLVTAIVQASGAVIVAVIGFVNAGIMTLPQSVGVIFGANIGTTVTGWIVAAVGIDVNIKALALPLIGIGALLRVTGGQSRRRYFGDAFTGFGLFFLGIEVLQSTFLIVQDAVNLAAFNIGGPLGIVLFVFIGFMLTVAMQSSSAATALVMTATMSGVITIDSAAAAVIGTNIGTTTTAGLSVIGATYNAKKVAAAHIVFNFGTGLIALFLIPVFSYLVTASALHEQQHLATALALFHTAFNVLGVLFFLPLTGWLVDFLNKHIGRKAAELGKPKYLDKNILTTPTLAMDALFMELGRLGELTRETCQDALSSKFRNKNFLRNKLALGELIQAIRDYCVKIQRLDLPENVAVKLPRALRVAQYYSKTINVISDVFNTHALLDHDLPEPAASVARAFRRNVKHVLNVAHTPCAPEFDELENTLAELLDHYHDLKEELLDIGALGTLSLTRMVDMLDYYSHMRQMCEQAVKGTTHWAHLRNRAVTCANADKENDYAWKLEG